ncbi:hypothetical protein V6N13_091041 [Hibiscus sabdariffa]
MNTLLRKFSLHLMLWMQMLKRQRCNGMELNRWKMLMKSKKRGNTPFRNGGPIKVLFLTYEVVDDIGTEPETKKQFEDYAKPKEKRRKCSKDKRRISKKKRRKKKHHATTSRVEEH